MKTPLVYVALQQFCEADPGPRQLLREAGFEVRENPLGRRLTREELPQLLQEADAVLAGVEPYDAQTLAALPKLRCISRCGIGTDAIDLAAARRAGITICTTGDEVIEPVAQLTVAMMLALARHLPQHLHDARDGLWKKRTGALLSEWTIGLIGFGRIGRKVEQCLRPLAPRILVTDPQVAPTELPSGAALCPLEQLLAESDCVSLHVSRPKSEGSLIGKQEPGRIKPGSVFINTARGYLVDEPALLEALQQGRLSGAALDVFEAEPYAGPLASLPQVIITPHVGSLTRASRAAMEWQCARNVVEFFSGGSRLPGPTRAGGAGKAEGSREKHSLA